MVSVDFTTCSLRGFQYLKKKFNMFAIDLCKQTLFAAACKVWTENYLYKKTIQAGNTKTFFNIGETEKTIPNFLQGSIGTLYNNNRKFILV